ncbi:MAG TPA: hypothetical protein VEY30_11400 [Myxococcaceae bacterium]|nr:hypothetical protein [Myxococcaceae bacterium]
MRDDNDRLRNGDLPENPFEGTIKVQSEAKSDKESGHSAEAAGAPEGEPTCSARTRLLSLVESAGVEVFVTQEGEAWATRAGLTYRIHSKDFRAWLASEWFVQATSICPKQVVEDVLEFLESRARTANSTRPVFVRVGRSTDGVLWLDLGQLGSARAIRLSPEGWSVTESPGVHLSRERGSDALPAPRRGRGLESMRPLLNLSEERDWVLGVTWLMGATRPDIPLPILNLQGEHGSAKSTTARLLRTLIDPATPELRAMPRDEENLMVAGRGRWVLAFDNLSGLSHAMSDALCRLSSGGGVGKRKLFTDGDEALLSARRPVILNGIDDLLSRNDFASRAIVLNLPSISEEKRRTEAEVFGEFEQMHPELLGALCDCVCEALRSERATRARLGTLPRLADLMVWASAAEGALGWTPGTVQRAMADLAEEVAAEALERDDVAVSMVKLMTRRQEWSGTMTELKAALEQAQGERISPSWPRGARALSNALKRAAPVVRRHGIVWTQRKSGSTRLIQVLSVPTVPTVTRPKNIAPSERDDWDGRDEPLSVAAAGVGS